MSILVAALLSASAPAEDALRAADLALGRTVASRDAKGFRALLDPECVFGSEAGLARGADTVVRRWTGLIETGGITWTPDEAEVAASGELGYTTGRFRIEGSECSGEGRYATVWRKTADGGWRVMFDFPLQPPSEPSPGREPLQTMLSRAGDLDATIGRYGIEDAGGVWLQVRRRDDAGVWRLVVDSEIPAGS